MLVKRFKNIKLSFPKYDKKEGEENEDEYE